jgi:hypothetical protein
MAKVPAVSPIKSRRTARVIGARRIGLFVLAIAGGLIALAVPHLVCRRQDLPAERR